MKRMRIKKQTSFPGHNWIEGLPIGNGITSAMMLGNVGREHLFINRFDRWEGRDADTLPDVSEEFYKMRDLIRHGHYGDSNFILTRALTEKGYDPIFPPVPSVPYEMTLEFICTQPFSRYERGILFDSGEAYVTYRQGEATLKRRAFVSMADDAVVLECSSDEPFSVKLSRLEGVNFSFSYTKGKQTDLKDCILIENTVKLLVTASFGDLPKEDYDTLLKYHLPLWEEAMGDAELSLGDSDRNNEALIEDNNDNGISPELLEKLWRYGRYLFVSGTAEGGLPFALYGLWSCEKDPLWAQNVANENVQIIYHHAAVGGLVHLVRPLIHYYYGQMDKCREAARKLFGCRGIFVSVYSTPVSAYPSPNVPVIINYISAAAWLCRHFYEYYVYTGDEELLESEILPFMLETAQFYEDYIIRENGIVEIVPSVSPENSPKNLIPEDKTGIEFVLGHPNPAVRDSTMDHALLKELLTHLLDLADTHPDIRKKSELWREILSEIPEYRINSDGAIAEWMDEELEDSYDHRHLSHVYPLFPGEEIGCDSPLLPAFEKAVDMRVMGGFAGWTYPHMSIIYSRLGRGESAVNAIDGMVKFATLDNLLTLGYDYREQGEYSGVVLPPIQLDAVMGAVGAVQEMLLRVKGKTLYILPALPDRLNEGSLKNWHFPEGTVDISWNKEEGIIDLNITGGEEYRIIYPEWYI